LFFGQFWRHAATGLEDGVLHSGFLGSRYMCILFGSRQGGWLAELVEGGAALGVVILRRNGGESPHGGIRVLVWPVSTTPIPSAIRFLPPSTSPSTFQSGWIGFESSLSRSPTSSIRAPELPTIGSDLEASTECSIGA
jgi:hypothetical protein